MSKPALQPDPDSTPAWIDGLLAGVREEWHLISSALLGIGLLLVLLSIFGAVPAKGVSAFIGCFLLLYGALIVLQRPLFSGLGRTLQQRMHAAVLSNGFGFYGVMTLARFLQLELHDLIEGLAEFDFGGNLVRELFMDWLIGFSQQSLMNSIDAFMWPVKLMTAYGMYSAGIIAGAAWLLYTLGAKVFPEVHRGLDADDDATKSEQATSR